MMTTLERGQELHDRSCRGGAMSPEEQAELESWYAEMDAHEEASLKLSTTDGPSNEDLRAAIRRNLAELQTAIEQVRQTEDSNNSLRRQNEELKQTLVASGILTG